MCHLLKIDLNIVAPEYTSQQQTEVQVLILTLGFY